MSARHLIPLFALILAAPAAPTRAADLDLRMPKIVLSAYCEHVSHLTQHFGSRRTNFGYETINASITFSEHGTRGVGPFLTLAEGYNFSSGGSRLWIEGAGISGDPGMNHFWAQKGFGDFLGPREIFSARLGWRWVL